MTWSFWSNLTSSSDNWKPTGVTGTDDAGYIISVFRQVFWRRTGVIGVFWLKGDVKGSSFSYKMKAEDS